MIETGDEPAAYPYNLLSAAFRQGIPYAKQIGCGVPKGE